MKFGKRLRFAAVFCWSEHYINYKRLKQVIKRHVTTPGLDVSEAFEAVLVEEVRKVDDFFRLVFCRLRDDVRAMTERAGDYLASSVCSPNGVAGVRTTLTYLSREISLLQDFIDLNHTAFRKITKKFDKKTRQHRTKYFYSAILAPTQFSNRALVTTLTDLVEAALAEVLLFLARRRRAARVATPLMAPSRSVKERLTDAIASDDAARLGYLLQTASLTPLLIATHGAHMLHAAARANDAHSIALLLAAGVPVDAPDVIGSSALTSALLSGAPKAAKALLAAGASVDSNDVQGRGVMMQAVQSRCAATVELVLQHLVEHKRPTLAARLCLQDRSGYSAFHYACANDLHVCLAHLLATAKTAFSSPPADPASSPAPLSPGSPGTRRGRLVRPRLDLPPTGATTGTGTDACAHTHNDMRQALRRDGNASLVWSCLNSAAYCGAPKCLKQVLALYCDKCIDERVAASASTALHSAARSGHVQCCRLLVDAGANPLAMNAYSETPMHLACAADNPKCLEVLLEGVPPACLQARLPPPLYRSLEPPGLKLHAPDVWVPLLIQAVEAESAACVKLLLKAGADPMDMTADGWHALAHALFRGQQSRCEIVDLLRAATTKGTQPLPRPAVVKPVSDSDSSDAEGGTPRGTAAGAAGAAGAGAGAGAGASPPPAPPDLFGHASSVGSRESVLEEKPVERALPDGQWELQLTYGGIGERAGMRFRKPAVGLYRFPAHNRLIRNRVRVTLRQHHRRASTQPNRSLGGTTNIPLSDFADESVDEALTKKARSRPAAESNASESDADITNEPPEVCLTLYEPWSSGSQFLWETLPPGVSTEADACVTIRGTSAEDFALAVDIKPLIGPLLGRAFVRWEDIVENRVGQLTTPIVGPALDHVGAVTFRYVLLNGHRGAHTLRSLGSRDLWKKTRVFGHRGAGANSKSYGVGPVGSRVRRTHVEENTLLSFVTAASLGAEYIEFDVHLSKDKVPVIYHDFLVKLPGGLKIPISSLTAEQLMTLHGHTPKREPAEGARRRTVDDSDHDLRLKRVASLQTVHSVKGSGSRPYPRRDSVAEALGPLRSSYITLAQAFKLVDKKTGFNIEIKYPFEYEIVDQSLVRIDRNELVNRVLDVVAEAAGSRDIMFSSFSPEVCVLVSRKQDAYPVFMLTTAGETYYADPRCNSIREAIRFAKRHRLFGIVSRAKPLVEAPRLITEVRAAGLILASYGEANNDADVCRMQRQYGVAAVIVDHVAHIAKAMRGAAALEGDHPISAADIDLESTAPDVAGTDEVARS